MTRNDYAEIVNIIQSSITPLSSKLQAIEDKVNVLSQDRVRREDIENLRKELVGAFVPRDAYEPRHAALIERDAQLESQIREVRKDYEMDMKELRDDTEKGTQRIHERLESGKQQLEDRIKQQSEIQLSTKDRFWMRVSQIAGFLGLAGALLDWLFQHVKLQ